MRFMAIYRTMLDHAYFASKEFPAKTALRLFYELFIPVLRRAESNRSGWRDQSPVVWPASPWICASGALVYFLRVVWRELGELDRLRQSSGRTGRRQS